MSSPSTRAARALRWIGAQALLHAGALALGFGLFVALFQTDLWAGVTILFYRGLLLLIAAFLLTLVATAALAGVGRAWGLRRRDALGACMLSLSLNLGFFVVLPVTVDRSVSVFLLGQMAAHPEESYSAERARRVFDTVYLGAFHQMERRLAEQTASGNVAPQADGYVITPQGRAFIRFAGLVARIFRTDSWLIAGASAPDALPAQALSASRSGSESGPGLQGERLK